ncbi:hypothetical protein M0R19_00285 [Candidatus Pacearchaeota archaeon]|nr:hypothetical protein [Candidatus Pacearchaeota archaeon]
MINKEGISRKNLLEFVFIFLFAISLIFMLGFAVASTYSFWGQNNESQSITINYTNASGLTVNEDVQQNFSITINFSSIRMGASFNLTQVNITLPAGIVFINGSNATGGNLTAIATNSWMNFTFSNTTSIGGGARTLTWTNETVDTFILGTNNTQSYNDTKFYFNFTAYTPGNYNIIVDMFFNHSLAAIASNQTTISIRVNDTTKPFNVNVTTMDGVNFSRGANNVSGSWSINVSAYDNGNLSGVGDDVTGVNVSFFNTTHGIVYSYALANASGNDWTIAIDTSQISDGTYNVSFIVNDSNGNINRTANMSIKVDNSAPTGTMVCTPADDVFIGGTVSCTCTVTDSFVGINTSRTAYNASPTTTDSGDITQTCYFSDLAGNEGTATDSYTIWGTTSSGSGSSGGSSSTTFAYTATIPKTSQEFSQIQTIQTSSFSGGGLAVKQKVTFNFSNEIHYVGIRAITTTKATVEIASTPTQYDLDIGEEVKKDLDGDGFYDVYVKLNGITNGKADMTINYIHEEIPAGSGTTTTTGEELPSGEEGEAQSTEEGMPIWVWIVVALVVLAIVIGGGIAMKRKKR